MALAVYASLRYFANMDIYELVILNLSAISLVFAGCVWHSIRTLAISAGILSFIAISLYADTLSNAGDIFLLEYLLASQSA
ncbi:MAG: c-type cytochrome biogenesis protein CcsB, partial [Gammaproteobacteria bacterium]|nr:c-type cytochrome biogenesis protein CcsB [Gammaproteobacteria bacterium]NIR94044.1 c-type cytochrome biogenesis protein CcsB [Gammaproteobacteria bacterium]NIW43733.1 c-type cytochrome biogenesis protein CcsB [Gammaproteobacteria bacterium]